MHWLPPAPCRTCQSPPGPRPLVPASPPGGFSSRRRRCGHPCERDTPRLVELAFPAACLAALGHQLAFRREHLKAVVAAVDDDQVAAGLADDSGRPLQFAGAAPGRAPLADEFTVQVENGNRALPLVRHIHFAIFADRDAERPNAVLVLVAKGCEFGEQFLLARSADLDVIDPHAEIVLVAAIGYVDVAIITKAHGLWVIKARAVRGGSSDRVAPVIGSAFDVCR